MRFLFVDKIDAIEGDRIRGRVRFPSDEPMQYARLALTPQVATGAVAEALGQLASWLCIQRNDFSARPVFLFADRIQNFMHIQPGAEVLMDCTVGDMDERTFNFSGTATLDGQPVATIENCNGYFMPLDQLEDPEVTRARFEAMTTGGLILSGRGGAPFAFERLVDDVIAYEADKFITTVKRMDVDYPFYADHFPRFPVTPIVILNEMIGVAAKRMLQVTEEQDVLACEVSGIKIKNFVKQGETCTVKVQVIKDVASDKTPSSRIVTTMAEIHKDERRILRGRYVYEIKGVRHGKA